MRPVAANPASTLLRELGVSDPNDIEVEAIAQFRDATIVYERLSGCAARVLGNKERAIITVNADAPRERQRFSAAHELGHWHYDSGRIAFSCTDEMMSSDWFGRGAFTEQRANRYAADLLMPAFLFDPIAKRSSPSFDAVRYLAGVFQPSLTATAIRYVEAGVVPLVLVCSSIEGRRWFVSGPDVPTQLWPRQQLGRTTQAHDLLHGASGAVGPGEVDADEWFNHRDAGDYVVMEESVKVTPTLVVSLVWWRDEQQLLDLQEDE